MDLLSCASCGQILENNIDRCPKCGSDKKDILYNILSRVGPDSPPISMSIAFHHKIWTYLPRSIQYTLNNMPVNPLDPVKKGLCLQIIISTAALVEGIVTDHLSEELGSFLFDPAVREEYQKKLDGLNHSNWRKKKKLLEFVKWHISGLENYDVVDVLFNIRDNLGHGKSYSFTDTRIFRGKAMKRETPVTIESENYSKVYAALFEKGILSGLDNNPALSIEAFLLPEVANYFYHSAIAFLHAFFKSVKLTNGINIYPEFERSL